jgi:hypothetical protein
MNFYVLTQFKYGITVATLHQRWDSKFHTVTEEDGSGNIAFVFGWYQVLISVVFLIHCRRIPIQYLQINCDHIFKMPSSTTIITWHRVITQKCKREIEEISMVWYRWYRVLPTSMPSIGM